MTKHYVVVGNHWGDADVVRVVEANSTVEAAEKFIELMWELDGATPEARREAELCDEGVNVTMVLVSDAPITVTYRRLFNPGPVWLRAHD